MQQQVCAGQLILEKNGFFEPLDRVYPDAFLFNPIDDTMLMFGNGWETSYSQFYKERQGLFIGQYVGVLPVDDGLFVVYQDKRASYDVKRVFAIRPGHPETPYYLVHAPYRAEMEGLLLTDFNPETNCPRLKNMPAEK